MAEIHPVSGPETLRAPSLRADIFRVIFKCTLAKRNGQIVSDIIMTTSCSPWFILGPGITLTVSPSNNVEVHQVVTLQCELDPNSVPPILVIFSVKPTTTLCVLEPLNGTCKYSQSSCLSTYNASCSNETVFSIQVNVPQSWNGASICCQTIYATSNYVNFSVKGKPWVANSNVTLGVTDTAVLNCSVIVIAFPEPQYELNYINGTRNTHMMHTITRNTINNFSINFNQKSVNECDRGTYHLKIWNLYGETTIIVNIFKQRKPDNPRNIGVKCEGTRAIVQWISSFNGGDHQTFDVFALNGQQRGNQSIRIPDMETKNSQTGTIAGSVAGILLLITIVLIVFLINKRYVCDLSSVDERCLEQDVEEYANTSFKD
uniref:Uncharacterized protein n=1 Tax=Magallana gigas TaxID=29159 RepID=K1QLL3_MAGGI